MTKEKHNIFKITVASTTLGLSLALSMLEIPIKFSMTLPAANFEIGDSLILLVIPLIGPWLAIFIGSIKPWLHVLIPHHLAHQDIIIAALLGMLLNALVISLYFGFNYLWKTIFKKENIYTKCGSIFLCCIIVALFAGFNIQLWAIDALGVHTHDHSSVQNSIKNQITRTKIIISYGIYGGFIFIKYLITFFVMLILEKPIIRYAKRVHYSYHRKKVKETK